MLKILWLCLLFRPCVYNFWMVKIHKFGIYKTAFLWSALKSFITFVCFQHVLRDCLHYLTSAKQQELAVILLRRRAKKKKTTSAGFFFLVQLHISGDNGWGVNVKPGVQKKVSCASRRLYLQADDGSWSVALLLTRLQCIWLVLHVVWSIHSSQLCSLSPLGSHNVLNISHVNITQFGVCRVKRFWLPW